MTQHQRPGLSDGQVTPTLFPVTEHNHGCGTLLPLPPGVSGSAVFGGPNDAYRYRLERRVIGSTGPAVMFLWMNPSGADPLLDDRTVRRGWSFAQAWGFSHMFVGNADAYRCTDQARLAEVPDPSGPDNLFHLQAMAAQSELIVVGYGQPKVRAVRDHGPRAARALMAAGFKLHVLALSADGTPKHPLYLAGHLRPQPWGGPR